MKRILLSVGIVGFVAAVVIGATGAFFSDTETSTGNTFTAGSIDLKVDSKCHYYQLGVNGYANVGCGPVGVNGVGIGQWSETDLENGVHKFFSFADLKPGDFGEDTISLHVYDNDAWGQIVMDNMVSAENSCTEPELDAEVDCDEDEDGELLAAMLPFTMWLDQGALAGFQNVDTNGVPFDTSSAEGIQAPDPTEGDNVWQDGDEPSMPVQGTLELSQVLFEAYENGDGQITCTVVNGRTDSYGDVCHGLALDGRMVGSTTYYIGLAWSLPLETGNDVQTDSLSGDITFEVEQHRNNPDPFE